MAPGKMREKQANCEKSPFLTTVRFRAFLFQE
jgi:hypothetical protein